MRFVLVLVSAILFSSCSTANVIHPITLDYGVSEEAIRIAAVAEVCPSPVPAKITVSTKFRDGGFCGGGYPNYTVPPIEDEEDRDRLRRVALRYYSVRPFDEIDAVCQRHDICYTLNQNSQLECNDKFHSELEAIRKVLKSQIGFWTVDAYQFRCQILIGDLQIAATGFMPASSEVSGRTVGTWVGRGIASPILGVSAGARAAGKRFLGDYPYFGETCNSAMMP
jgi:hypothetical protein